MRKAVFGSVDIDRIYYPGLHFLPISSTFVCFDSTYQPIAWLNDTTNNPIVAGLSDDSVTNPPLSVALSDGVPVQLELLLEYRPDMTRLGELFNKYGTTYLSQIVSITASTIKTAVIGFTQADYTQRRERVRMHLAVALSDALYTQLGVFVPVNKLQLLNVILPDSVVQTNLRAAMSIQCGCHSPAAGSGD
jgi:hypothetical protein